MRFLNSFAAANDVAGADPRSTLSNPPIDRSFSKVPPILPPMRVPGIPTACIPSLIPCISADGVLQILRVWQAKYEGLYTLHRIVSFGILACSLTFYCSRAPPTANRAAGLRCRATIQTPSLVWGARLGGISYCYIDALFLRGACLCSVMHFAKAIPANTTTHTQPTSRRPFVKAPRSTDAVYCPLKSLLPTLHAPTQSGT